MNYYATSVDKIHGELALDTHNIANGYFFAQVIYPVTQRLKLKIMKDDYISIFDLKNNGSFEMFPLQAGNGTYQIALYKNIAGTKYGLVGCISLNVILKDKNACFLVPNQYINYHQIPEIVAMTQKMCYRKTKNECYNIIKNFIKTNFVYDFIKAKQIKKGMLPDMRNLLKTKSGICFDIASFAVAMLRICKIPAKLVIGMADNRYHAWVEIINEKDKNFYYDPTFDIYGINKIHKYIPERYY